MNRDEGSYTLSRAHDHITSLPRQELQLQEELNKLLLVKVSDRDQNVKVVLVVILIN